MTRRVRRLLAAVLCALLLAGCSGGSDDASSDSSSDAADSTHRELPAAATRPGLRGAKAFARHWVRVLNRATTSGETDALRALAASGCTGCDRMATAIEELYAAGGKIQGDGWKVTDVLAEPGLPDERAELVIVIRRRPEAVYPSEDAEPELFGGGRERYLLHLRHRDDAWTVTDVGRVSTSN